MLKRFLTFKNIIFLILVAIMLFTLPKIANILMLFFAAFVIACALNPFVDKLEPKLGRCISSVIAVLVSCILFVALFIPILIMTVKEIKIVLMSLPERILMLIDFITTTKIFNHRLADFVSPDTILPDKAGFASSVVNQSWSFTLGIFETCVIGVAMMMIVYYLLSDKKYLQSKFIEFFPQQIKEKANYILQTISRKVGGYISAQLLSMAAVGTMTTILLLILNVDYAFLLGLITGILDIIPIAGPTVAVAIILIVAYPISIWKVVLIIALFITVQQLSNYIVRPLVFSKWMQLHPLMIFLALFLAQQFLGFWGVILSPAIAAVVCVLIDELYLAPINANAHEDEDA